MNIAFAGLRHGHIYVLYEMAKQHTDYHICGAFEADAKARANAAERGVFCNYGSYEQLLSDDAVDAVALGGCYGERGQMAIKALQAGKRVIADKPLCTSLDDLEQIERLSKEKGIPVTCMLTMRFEPKVRAVKRLVESGALGEINNVYFGGQHPLQYGRRPMWYFESGKHGGVINDIAIHGVDVLSFALGLRVDTVVGARCWNCFATDQPQFLDSAQCMLTAENGAGVLADVSYAITDGVEFAHPQYWRFHVWGTKGSISFSLNETSSYYFVAGDATAHLLEEAEHEDFLTDFRRLCNGETDVVITPQEVLDATRVTLQIQKFADEKGENV